MARGAAGEACGGSPAPALHARPLCEHGTRHRGSSEPTEGDKLSGTEKDRVSFIRSSKTPDTFILLERGGEASGTHARVLAPSSGRCRQSVNRIVFVRRGDLAGPDGPVVAIAGQHPPCTQPSSGFVGREVSLAAVRGRLARSCHQKSPRRPCAHRRERKTSRGRWRSTPWSVSSPRLFSRSRR